MDVRREVWQVYREALPILLVSLVGGLVAGTALGTDAMVRAFDRFPGMWLLLPAFLATRGNVYGSLGARISSGIHQGLVVPEFEWQERLVNAVVASFVNGISISVFIGVTSWGLLQVLGRESAGLLELVGIMFVAGTLTSVVLIVGLLALIFASYEYGMDPDNLVGPIVTTLGDIFGVTFLYVALFVVGVTL
jgi:mgtE-like transporter